MIKNNGCCDLEWAKKLKELGVKQESLWWWEHHIFNGREHRKPDNVILRLEKDTKTCDGKRVEFKSDVYQKSYYSAFTISELGEMLPYRIENDKRRWGYIRCERVWSGEKWSISYRLPTTQFFVGENILDYTFANAMAKMLCWLIEQGRVEV